MDAVIVIGLFFVVWIIVGGVSNSSFPLVPTDPDRREECRVCDKLDAWWEAQDFFGKAAGLVWYGINKAACAIKGC